MRKTTLLLLAGLVACFYSGCATITRGTKDTLVVESEPAGATVKLSNGQTGKTPTSFKLPRKESLVVTIEKEGYESLSVNVHSQISGAGAAGMAGNVLVGGIVGAVVDPLSGAMKDLKPNPVKVTLVAIKKPEAAAVAATPAPTPAPAPVATPAATPEPAAPAVAAAPAAPTPAPASTAAASTGTVTPPASKANP